MEIKWNLGSRLMPEDVWDAGPSSLQKMICFLALWTKSKQVPAWLFCVCLKCHSGQKPWSSTFAAVAEVSDCIRLAGWLATWQVWRCLLKSIKKWRHWMALDNYLIISNPFEPVKSFYARGSALAMRKCLGQEEKDLGKKVQNSLESVRSEILVQNFSCLTQQKLWKCLTQTSRRQIRMTCLKSKRRGVRRSKPTWGEWTEWTNHTLHISAQTGRASRLSFPFMFSSGLQMRDSMAWCSMRRGAPSSLFQALLGFRCDLLQTKRLAYQPCWHAQKMRAMGRAEIANGDLPNMKNIIINSSMILWLLYQIICYLMPTLPTHQKNM